MRGARARGGWGEVPRTGLMTHGGKEDNSRGSRALIKEDEVEEDQENMGMRRKTVRMSFSPLLWGCRPLCRDTPCRWEPLGASGGEGESGGFGA